jgi:enoyl-CoA hydratase/carnithine racemase
MSDQLILSERMEGVVVVTLNRPDKFNALSFALAQELDTARATWPTSGHPRDGFKDFLSRKGRP